MSETGPSPAETGAETRKTLFERVKSAVMEEAGRNFEASHERRVEELIASAQKEGRGEEAGLRAAEEYLKRELVRLEGKGALLQYRDETRPETPKNAW